MRGLPTFLQASPKEHLGLPKLREITNYQSLLVLVTLTKEECYNSHLSAFWEAATLSMYQTNHGKVILPPSACSRSLVVHFRGVRTPCHYSFRAYFR